MLPALLTIAGVHLIALASPGPDVFIVMQTAASRSRREAFCCVLGISLGVAFWVTLALLGLQWLFDTFIWLHKIVMGLGGMYLLWMSFNILRHALSRSQAAENVESEVQSSAAKAFITGLCTNLANAKAIVYFSVVFAPFITPDMSGGYSAVIGILVVLETFLWFSFVALLLGMPKPKQIYRSAGRWIDGVCGVIFGAFGAALLYSAAVK
ncbi:LysE family transporter [uncultured Parasutterella sp.]|uniref:LysE family transporter n=1 Tax=uncultured Parasutterella sp. TaxID=1263098 RepID=UPI002595F874|nr:LysE family transporter [uncultured Parasutterella sp.]